MKRLIYPQSIIRSLLLIVGLLYYGVPASASECDFEVNGICYDSIQGKTNEAAVTYRWYEGGRYGDGYSAHYTGSVTVPATVTYDGKTYKVTAVGSSAFRECSITSVSLPSSITAIGANAFCDCSNLYSITLPQGVKTIGAGAFDGCINLNSITIPSGVTEIGASAFYDCRNLYSINFPSMLKTIGANAFTGTGWYNYQADGLVYVGSILYKYKGTMPEGTSIRLNGRTTSISGSAFSDCTGLVAIDVPESVTSIGSYAFQNCSSLIDIYIPEGVSSIEDFVFSGCSSLPAIGLPDAVTSIGNYAFQGCSNLTAIELPDAVNSIGGYAFQGCSSLTSITIPKNVKTIGATPFSGSGLTDLTILCPNVSSALCNYLSSLQRVTFGENVESIGVSAFLGCNNLSTIIFNDKLSSIASSALDNTAWYENKPDGLVFAGKVAYKYKGVMPSGTECVLPEGTRGIAAYAFSGHNNLASITIPASVNNIGQAAFQNCNTLSSIVIPEGVKRIENSTFNNCSNLSSVSLPSSITEISEYGFSGCNSLTSITLPNNLRSIGNYTFRNCSLTEVTAKMQEPATLSAQTFSYISSYSSYNYVGSITLYVPSGCKEAYEAADVWKDFKEIVEMGGEQEEITDISQVENAIYVDKTEVRTGLKSTLDVKAKNALTVAGVSFTLELPEGLSLAKDEDEEIVCELAGERAKASKFSVFSVENGDRTYSFRIMPTSTAVINGNDGTLLSVQLQVPEMMEAGDYDLRVTDNRFTVKEEDTMRTELLPNVLSTLTVSTIEPGDVNGDNELDLTDAIMIVYYSLNLEQAGFNKAVADVNNDGMIDLTDAIIVVYKSLGVQ